MGGTAVCKAKTSAEKRYKRDWSFLYLNGGKFPYEQFMEELRGYDVRQFDADHILIPPMTKAELEKLAGKLRGKERSV